MEECLNAVQCKVTDDTQEFLSSEFTAEEVKVALFQMGPTKAPGPDGMNALFLSKILACCREYYCSSYFRLSK